MHYKWFCRAFWAAERDKIIFALWQFLDAGMNAVVAPEGSARAETDDEAPTRGKSVSR